MKNGGIKQVIIIVINKAGTGFRILGVEQRPPSLRLVQ